MSTDRPRIPRITERSKVPEEHRQHWDRIEETRGGVRGPFTVLMNSPELCRRIADVGAYVRFESQLSDTERELAIITTAREYDAAFEWAAHVPIARDAGVREEAIDVVAERAGVDALTDVEGTIVRYGRTLLQNNEVADSIFEDARETFGVQGVTELTATFGYYGMIACALNAFEVLPEDDAEHLGLL